MISSREEYKFVDIDAGIRVNGEIMPLREEARKNDLRGEDVAFLMEAQGERHDALWGFSLAKKQMTKEISGERLKDVQKDLLTCARLDGENWSAYFIKEQLPEGDAYGLASTDAAKELGLTFADYDFSSKVWNFESGGALRRIHMERLFADADMLRIPCLWAPGDFSFVKEIALSTSADSGSVGGASVPEIADFDGAGTYPHAHLYEYFASCQDYGTDGETDWRGSWIEQVVDGGSLSYTVGTERAKWIRPITRTLCICSVRHATYGVNALNPSTSGESSAYDAFSCPSVQAGGAVTLDAASLAAGAKRLLAHHGFSKLALPFAGRQVANVTFANIIPVCELGDHTRWQST